MDKKTAGAVLTSELGHDTVLVSGHGAGSTTSMVVKQSAVPIVSPTTSPEMLARKPPKLLY
jgi:hypothetical protein